MSKTTSKEVDHTSIKLRAYPNQKQRLHISQACGSCRSIYNWGLSLKLDQYQEWLGLGKPKDFKWISCSDLQKRLPQLKAERPWLKEVPSQSLQQVLKQLDVAFSRFFKGYSKYPKFKSYSRSGSFHITNQVLKEEHLEVSDKWLYLTLPKKQGTLKVRLHRALPVGILLKTVILKTSSTTYYVSLNYEVEYGSLLKVSEDNNRRSKCGVDLGVKQPLTVAWKDATKDDGYNSKVLGKKVKARLEKAEKNRKKYQRKYSRRLESFKRRQKKVKPNKVTGEVQRVSTKNLDKSRLLVAKAYQKEVNIRKDFAEKTSFALATKFEIIKFENLSIKSMTATVKKTKDGSSRKGVSSKSGLNREMLRLGLATVVSLTEYKASLYGGKVLKVNPKYTSQRCHVYGSISKFNRKSQADFECISCGHVDNADRNAAINILHMKPVAVVKPLKVAWHF